MYQFGTKLKRLRERLNKSQRDMGLMLQTSHVNYGRYERGDVIAPVTFVIDLHKNVPNLNLEWLFSEDIPDQEMLRGESKAAEPSINYLSSSLSDYEQKAVELVEKIEHGPWRDDVKLRLIDSILAIVERDLEKLNSET